MEVVGLVLGVTGVIAVADKALLLAQLIHEIKDFSKDTSELIFQLANESQKIHAWALQASMHIQPGEESQLMRGRRSKMSEKLGVDIRTAITRIQLAIDEANVIMTAYGFNAPPSQEVTACDATRVTVRQILEHRQQEVQLESLKRRKKLKFLVRPWGKSDKQTLSEILQRLKYWNGELWSILSRHEERELNFQVTCQIMSVAHDIETLSVVETCSIEFSTDLSVSAALGKKRLQLENSVSIDTGSLVPWGTVELSTNGQRGQTFAKIVERKEIDSTTYHIVDWIYYGDLDEEQKIIATSRVTMLHALLNTSKPPNLRTLTSDGYVDDSLKKRYGLLLQLPNQATSISPELPDVLSLGEILETSQTYARPTLAERFQLAQRITTTFMELHNSRWLHKGFTSAKVIFISTSGPNISTKISYNDPYIVGFEFSRPTGRSNVSLPVVLNPGTEIYMHPRLRELNSGSYGEETVTRYRRGYDLYSLSLVLLEIALWQPLSAFAKKKFTPEKLHARFITIVEQNVAHTMGSNYKNAILAGLRWLESSESAVGCSSDGDESDAGQLQRMYWEIVRPIESCACRND